MNDTKTFRREVRETVSPWKFGNDRLAAALWLVSLDGCLDEEGGDVETFGTWFGRYGRWIVLTDEQGFVWRERCQNEAAAVARFTELSDLAAPYL